MSVESTVTEKINNNFTPEFLEVLNESHKHSVPANSETHFKVTLVSESFEGMSRVKRHQAIYQTLAEEVSGPIHALALHLFTATEWTKVESDLKSPDCAGGGK